MTNNIRKASNYFTQLKTKSLQKVAINSDDTLGKLSLSEKLIDLFRIKTPDPDLSIDFTDNNYQAQLPLHARSTAAQVCIYSLQFTNCNKPVSQ